MVKLSRSLAAFTLGAGFALGGFALARGLDMDLHVYTGGSGGFIPNWSYDQAQKPRVQTQSVRDEDDGDFRPAPSRRKRAAALAQGEQVCVRLCDGFFFPAGATVGGESACAAQCPDAPTALYTMTTDRIEDAVAIDGKKYTALPVARRYQASFENTCTCRRGSVGAPVRDFAPDPTLRRGDAVMTALGLRVYEGNGYSAATARDFVALSRATDLPKEQRAALAQIERATSGTAPNAVRPHGSVTVDSGPDRSSAK